MSTRQSIRNLVQSENSSNQVVIYSKSYCPYCAQTKALFRSLPGIQLKVHELDKESNGYMVQDELSKMTGQRTVPNVFVNNQHVGGNQDVQQLYRTGKLEELLKNQPAEETNRQTSFDTAKQ